MAASEGQEEGASVTAGVVAMTIVTIAFVAVLWWAAHMSWREKKGKRHGRS